jgi:iron complex transport system substrate-binding protein
MKTKNSSFGKAFLSKKRFALVEIAIVLCSVFLAALPTIAAEQTTIASASEDDFVLGIYGNANEDDTIDMRDLTYVKLIFFGKKPETELADAKYDGKINPLDFIQIKLIIVGKEKEITIVDSFQTIVTINKPLKRLFITSYNLETLRSVKVDLKDIIVGASELDPFFFPEFCDVPQVPIHPRGRVEDTEAVLNLDPEAVIYFDIDPVARGAYDAAGISVIVFKPNVPAKYMQVIRTQGYIFDKEDEAEEFIDWYEDILNTINERVENILEEEKPKVYSESAHTPYFTYPQYGYITETGGKDIFASSGSVDPEAIIDRDPDIIVKGISWRTAGCGYGVDADDTAKFEERRDEILTRDELKEVTAVKNKRVYIISTNFMSMQSANAQSFLQLVWQAKWFQPDVFEDLDPKAIHQEYLTRFQGLDIDLDEKGVFVYPEEPV